MFHGLEAWSSFQHFNLDCLCGVALDFINYFHKNSQTKSSTQEPTKMGELSLAFGGLNHLLSCSKYLNLIFLGTG